MKNLFISFSLLIFSNCCNAQWWKSLYGDQCVVLNLKTTDTDYGDKPYTWSFEENMDFENETVCRRYFNNNYGNYPFDHTDYKFRGEIFIKYQCVPCSLVYESKKAKPELDKNCESRIQNAQKFKEAKSCFTNEDSYNNALNALKKIDCNIYSGDITCQGGKINITWYKKTEQDNKLNVPENERSSIDNFYDDLKEKSKAREVNKIEKQIKDAQTQKEISELLNTLHGLFKGVNDTKNNQDNSNNGNVTSNQVMPDQDIDGETNGIKTINADGSTTFTIDTDNDGSPDQQITYDQNGKPKSEITINCDNTPVLKPCNSTHKIKCKDEGHGCLKIKWVGMIDNAEGDLCPHGPSGSFHILIFHDLNHCIGDEKFFNKGMLLPGSHSGDYCPCWPKFPEADCEWLDGDELTMDCGIYPWKSENEEIWVVIYESDKQINIPVIDLPITAPFRKQDVVYCGKISRKATLKISNPYLLYYLDKPAHDDAIKNCKAKNISWYKDVWQGGLNQGIPSIFIKVKTE